MAKRVLIKDLQESLERAERDAAHWRSRFEMASDSYNGLYKCNEKNKNTADRLGEKLEAVLLAISTVQAVAELKIAD